MQFRSLVGARKLDHLARLSRRHRQRLLAHHVFAGFERRLHDGKVQRVGSAHVHRIDGRVFEQLAIVLTDFVHMQLGAQPRCVIFRTHADRVYLDIAQAADALDMDPPHKPSSEYRCF